MSRWWSQVFALFFRRKPRASIIWKEEDYPVENFYPMMRGGTKEAWLEWLEKDRQAARDGRYPELVELVKPGKIVVVDGGCVWHGIHRAALAIESGVPTVKATVGRLKS